MIMSCIYFRAIAIRQKLDEAVYIFILFCFESLSLSLALPVSSSGCDSRVIHFPSDVSPSVK